MRSGITSRSNPKVQAAAALREKRERDRTGLFLIEGYREILRAMDGNVRFSMIFIAPELFLGENEEALLERAVCPIFSLSKEIFEKLSYRDRPDGLVAVAYKMELSLESLFEKSPSFLVVAEAIEKPGNLGSILRSADAAGAEGLIVCDRCTDIYNPNVVRASVGTLFSMPVVEAEGKATRELLKREGFTLVAATPSAKQNFIDAEMKGKVALIVGCEQLGLSAEWLHSAHEKVRIPMLGCADSLNVANATTLLLYEIARKRGMLANPL